MAIGRILAGILMLLIFRRCFDFSKQFKGFVVMLPALVFALWNIANHFITKGDFNPFTLDILILGLAHAAIDITNRVFMGVSNTPVPVIIAFIVMLVIMELYAFKIVLGWTNGDRPR